MGLLKHKDKDNRVVVETVRPVEIPVITTVKQCLVRNNYGEAVRYGYQAALYDFQRAHGVVFPPVWTNKDVLDKGFKGAPGFIPALFAQLYKLYEPVRFGKAGSWNGQEGDVVGVLQSIYADESMWRLYAQRVSSGSGGKYPNGESAYRIANSDLIVSKPLSEGPMLPNDHRLSQSALYVRKEGSAQSAQ